MAVTLVGGWLSLRRDVSQARAGVLPGWLSAPPTAAPEVEPEAAASACAAPARIHRDGVARGEVCPDDAARLGLTVVDLSNAWAPSLFDDHPDIGALGRQPYRARYVALADGRFETLPEGHRVHHDRYLELYGIAPSPRLLRLRLEDEARHTCHDAVDDAALKELDRPLDAWKPVAAQKAHRWTIASMKHRLEQAAGDGPLSRLETDPRHRQRLAIYRTLKMRVDAVVAAQAHLRCEGLLDEEALPGILDHRTVGALHAYHRRHALVSWTLDPETALTMATDSRRLDYRQALRVLRERVVDATGLIEDGTASGAAGRVRGEPLDGEAMFHLGPQAPLPGGAPDLVGRATAAAAIHLGWDDSASTRRWLSAPCRAPCRVAVPLPPPPAYHRDHMDLRVEIDRGDVSYLGTYPGQRRPTLVLYAQAEGRSIPLVRWGTTIGGRKPEIGAHGAVVKKTKASPVGPRIWRDVVVTPRWIPPRRTPPRELLRPTRDGWTLRNDLLGPSYASAYGLVMMVHHRDDGAFLTDQGIRTHGSAKYDSIHQGTSHGCHRLHNHRSMRLASFLLKHRRHHVRGAEAFGLHRTFRYGRQSFRRTFETRGFRYELDPPVPVEVLRGRELGWRLRAR